MRIATNSGKTFEAAWALETETRNGVEQLTIHLTDTTSPMDALASLAGQAQIVGIKENKNSTTYEGYTLFRSLIVTPDGKDMRLTLERGDA